MRVDLQVLPQHPRHGIQDPSVATPGRRPGSVRRTSSIDMVYRPADGSVVLDGTASDRYTDVDGRLTVLETATMNANVDFMNSRAVTELTTSPVVPQLEQLIGVVAAAGFRSKLTQVAQDLPHPRSLLHLLLDDIPVAVLISGHTVGAQAVVQNKAEMSSYVGGSGYCAGFADDATMMTTFREEGFIPRPTGPVAPDLVDPGDERGWHDLPALPPYGMRRLRRLDLFRQGGRYSVDAMFRDSFVLATGIETVIHEYQLDAAIDIADNTILDIEAVPRVLPWLECPVAAASAGRLAGLGLAELNTTVRQQLQGTSTCTHLNDLLRSLADVGSLSARLESS